MIEKNGGSTSILEGIFCPPGWNRVNLSAKNLECQWHSDTPSSAIPVSIVSEIQEL